METLAGLEERVSRGEPIDDRSARLLVETPDLIAVGALGDAVRRRMHGTRTTFVRVLDVHVEAPPAALPARMSAGEIRIVGTPSSLGAAIAAVKAASAVAGGIPVTGFSLADVRALGGPSLASACTALANAGLWGLAEVALDGASDLAEAVVEARKAGLAAARLTVRTLAADDRMDAAVRARDLQDAVGGFRVFAPLAREVSISTPTTGYDDVKQIALARVVAANIASIQVDWPLYGPKLAQFALTVGADDVDGVAAVDPGILGTRRSPIEEIRGNIRAAALEPVERNGRFETIG